MSGNPNDPLRQAILEYLYELHLRHTGSRGHETEGRPLTESIRKRTGAPLEVVASNLHYLVASGFVGVREVPRFLSDKTQVDPRRLYSIAGPGIIRMEGKSEFVVQEAPRDVTVFNRDGVVTVGSDNTVTVGQSALPAILTALAEIIAANREISDLARQNALGDLETVRAQASKAKPDMGIINTAWEGVKIATTAREAAGLLQQAAAILGLL